ncbi:flagellar basal body-associated FliL family protein [Thermaurantiacus sp.]
MADALTISEDATAETGKKPGLRKRLFLPLLLLLVGLGAGAGGMLAAPRFFPDLFPAGDAVGEDGAPAPKPRKVRQAPLSYIELDNSFTANLKDSGRYIQVKIALSTHGGEPVAEAVAQHKVAIVAATLAVLADTSQADFEAPGGRERLAARMRMAINDVLMRKSGAAGIDDVFLTSFVVQ